MTSKMSTPIEEGGKHGEGWAKENEGALAHLWQANLPLYNTNLKEFQTFLFTIEI